MVALVEAVEETICAFCLMTSAGVRMAQETSSAMEEAAAWRTGVGMRPLGCAVVEGLMWVKRAFVRSYVVKNAPAGSDQPYVRLGIMSLCHSRPVGRGNSSLHEGRVAMMTLPTP